MTELHYLSFLFVCSLVAALLGAIAHFWRAGVGPGFGRNERDGLFNLGGFEIGRGNPDYLYEKHIQKLDFDSEGYWDGASWRNLSYYVASSAVMPWLIGLFLWSDRQTVLAGACRPFLDILGRGPWFCG